MIFIDECGMQDGDVAKFIVDIADMCKCLLVMVGDPYQIPCIKNNSYIESPIFNSDRFTHISLTGCYRQKDREESGLHHLSQAIRSAIDGEKFPDLLSFDGVEKVQRSRFIDAAAERFRTGNEAKIIALTGESSHIDGLNRHIKEKVLPGQAQSAFHREEVLITMADIKTDKGYITKDTDLRVLTVSKPRVSSIGIKVNNYLCQSMVDGQQLTISAALDIKAALAIHRELSKDLRKAEASEDRLSINEARRKINEYHRVAAPVTSAYAVSVFSAQGSDYDHVFLDLNGVKKKLDRQVLLRMLYVAVSRARKSLTIMGSLRADISSHAQKN